MLCTTLATTATDHTLGGQTIGLDFNLQRPGRLGRIVGKRARTDIPKDRILAEDMLAEGEER